MRKRKTTKDITEGFYPITSLSKDDLRGMFRGDRKALKRINEMTDDEMKTLASKMADDYCEQLYWSSLQILFESKFLDNGE
jgi:hypothetical protein